MAEQTESSIIIDAPAEKVMAVIADLGTYPEWAGVKQTRVLGHVSRTAGPGGRR